MKGVIFTEFYEFVEDAFSPLFLQEVINATDLVSHGIYAATGTYPFCEMGALVAEVSEKSGEDLPKLLRGFGHHLFKYFVQSSPHYFENVENGFEFLNRVENHIHRDVRKLYPDAELPRFDCLEHSERRYVMIYKSSRGLGDLCHGLIEACLDYFGESSVIRSEKLPSSSITEIKFTIDLKP